MASIFSTRTSVLAVDLTSAGAPTLWQRERDPEAEVFIMSRLAGLAKLLDRAGADLITTGEPFRLGGKRRRDDHLDGVVALSRLGAHTSAVKFAASIPLSQTAPGGVAAAVSSVHNATAGRGGWQVDDPTLEATHAVDAVFGGLKDTSASPAVVVNVRNEVDVEIAAARANVARLRVNTVEEGRNVRSAIRSAAADWGRDADDITVLVDVHAVLAEETQDALTRAEFISDLAPERPEGLLQHAGTVNALANVWQNWVRAGAADGFTVLPGSIPTDVVEVATGLLPELHRRGLRTALDTVAATGHNIQVSHQVAAA